MFPCILHLCQGNFLWLRENPSSREDSRNPEIRGYRNGRLLEIVNHLVASEIDFSLKQLCRRCAFFPSSCDCLEISILQRSITRNSLSHSSCCCYNCCCFYKELSLIFGQNMITQRDSCLSFKDPTFFLTSLLQCSFIRCTYLHRLCTKLHSCTTQQHMRLIARAFYLESSRGKKLQIIMKISHSKQ